MEPAAYATIRRNPKFAELVQQRNKLARTLTIAMLVIYFGFILLVAFAPGFLGTPLGLGSVTTIGIPLGPAGDRLGLRADRHLCRPRPTPSFDRLNEELLREVK